MKKFTADFIFSKNQILTLAIAKTLIGKKIAVTNSEYSANSSHVRTGVVSSIETKWDLAAKEDHSKFDGGKWKTRQDYWLEKLPKAQHEEAKKTLKIVSDSDLYCTCDLSDKYTFKEPTFFGSDSDREIYFVIDEN